MNVPLVHSTAVDYGADWFTPYPTPEFLSSQPDASLKISFPGLIPTAQSEIQIERVRGEDVPICLQEQFGDGPVWRIEPVDRSSVIPIRFEVEARRTGTRFANPSTHRLLLLTESAEIKDLTGTAKCYPQDREICGTEHRYGYIMLATRR